MAKTKKRSTELGGRMGQVQERGSDTPDRPRASAATEPTQTLFKADDAREEPPDEEFLEPQGRSGTGSLAQKPAMAQPAARATGDITGQPQHEERQGRTQERHDDGSSATIEGEGCKSAQGQQGREIAAVIPATPDTDPRTVLPQGSDAPALQDPDGKIQCEGAVKDRVGEPQGGHPNTDSAANDAARKPDTQDTMWNRSLGDSPAGRPVAAIPMPGSFSPKASSSQGDWGNPPPSRSPQCAKQPAILTHCGGDGEEREDTGDTPQIKLQVKPPPEVRLCEPSVSVQRTNTHAPAASAGEGEAKSAQTAAIRQHDSTQIPPSSRQGNRDHADPKDTPGIQQRDATPEVQPRPDRPATSNKMPQGGQAHGLEPISRASPDLAMTESEEDCRR